MTCVVNIVLPTIRFEAVSKDIITHLLRVGETHDDVHVTIADGQEDDEKRRWICERATLVEKAGRFTYIPLKDPTERVYRAAQVETEWILPISDDDPYSVNYLRAACDAARGAALDASALLPRTYLCYSSAKLYHHQFQAIRDSDQYGRLIALFKQGQNGLFIWGVIRRRLFLDWMDFVRTKPIWPSYSDQLCVSYLAMMGKLEPMAEECAYLKDESDWHDSQRAILKDARSYHDRFLTVFHEVVWSADLFRFLRSHGLEDDAVPAVMARAWTLLQNGVGSYQPRLSVLNIEESDRTRDVRQFLTATAARASVVLKASVQEQIRFFEDIQAMSQRIVHDTESDFGRRVYEVSLAGTLQVGSTEGIPASDESHPTVSVIIPCYKQAHFLSDAVDSVVVQTYGDWECVIVDDGSPDETAEVASQLIARHPEKRIRLIRKENGGLSDARNAGIREAKGRYILPLDADDRLDPRYLEKTVAVLDTNPDMAIVYVDEQNFGDATHIHRKGVSTLTNLISGNVHDYCTLYRRSVWEQVGGYSPAMYLGAEDWCFWIAAAKRGLRSYHVKEPLFLYRNRPGTMVTQVHANLEIVKAHIVFHHQDLFCEAGVAHARAVLSDLNAQAQEKLDDAYAIHSTNVLLERFHRLATNRPEEMPLAAVCEVSRISRAASPNSIAEHGGLGSGTSVPGDVGRRLLSSGRSMQGTSWSRGDQEARWVKFAAFLEHILREARRDASDRTLRMIEVGSGCGSGIDLIAMYGSCERITPGSYISAPCDQVTAQQGVGFRTMDQVLAGPEFDPYDVVLCAQVIECVSQGQRSGFVEQMARLLKPGGYLLLATPRGEVVEQWRTIGSPCESSEHWMTEGELHGLLGAQGFHDLRVERVYVELPQRCFIPAPTPADLAARNLLPIEQVWACQRGESPLPTSVPGQPMVSVIVATYDRPDRLRVALTSVLEQSYRDFEIIVVNDGHVEVDSVIAPLNSSGRIIGIKHDRNRGLAAARNTGIRMARGKYLAYLDDDDRYFPNHLASLVATLEQGACKAVYSDAWRVHEQVEQGQYYETGRDLPYSYDFNPANLLVANYFPVLCVMHERSCLDEVGGFDESLFAHEDWDLWIRIATKYPFMHVKKITAEFTWRTDGSSMTSRTQQTYYRTREIIYRKYRPYAERIPGVLAAQEQQLAEYRTKVVPAPFDCSIIIPVWNKVELTQQCLVALASVTADVTFEVIVVNNGSTDGTRELLSSLTGDVQIIHNQENVGFAKACNQGARSARGRHLVFLNNDTIPKEGWLRALMNEADAGPDVGIVGSKLLYADGTIQHAGVVRDSRHVLPYHAYKSFAGDHPAVNQRREFQIVTAACLLIKRSVFQEVGGFDEGYLNGFEDADLCLKVRERGYTVVYQPRSVVVHLENQTPGRKAHEAANADRFLERWGAQWWAADEDKHFYVGGHKLKRIFRNGQVGADIQLIEDIRDRAAWTHVAAAQTAALNKDWQAVRRELELAEEWPNDPYVLSWGAMMAERLDEPVSRITLLTRSVDCTNNPDERLALVRTLLEQKDVVGAEEQLRVVLAASPNHADGLLLKGILSMQREQYGSAEDAFASALEEGANRKKCLMGMGMAAMGRAYTQGAWERFVEVLVDHPDDAEAIHWLLRAGTAQNRWEELADHLRSYVTKHPSDLTIRFALASVLLRGDQIEAARRQYDALRAEAPTYDGLDQLGQMIAGREAPLTTGAASC